MNKTDYEKYPLYLKSMGALFLILTIGWVFFMYLLWPGLQNLNNTLAYVMEGVLSLGPIILWFMFSIMAIASSGIVHFNMIIMRIASRFLYAFFPLLSVFVMVLGISKDQLSQALIDLLNHLVELNLYKVPADRVLLLTPHCLQKNTCVHKVTSDVYNCKQCGQCQVGELLQIAKDYGCKFVVVTGGTLARMMVKEARPKAIVAIACERDLVSGMSDVFPIPVIGILNERPNGPCFNTRVNTLRIRSVVEKLIDKNDDSQNTLVPMGSTEASNSVTLDSMPKLTELDEFNKEQNVYGKS